MRTLAIAIFSAIVSSTAAVASNDKKRIAEIDAYWAEVSRSVREGDFEGYKATCHEKGVLVSGGKKTCHPLSVALARWKQGFDDTKSGKMKANVEFRFSQRLGDETTAHETGIFHYSTEDGDGKKTSEYIHLQALLRKEGGKWKIVMEYQISKADESEWKALKL